MSGRRSLSVAFLTSARAWRGSGVSLSRIANGLAERGHRVHMLASEEAVLQEFERRGLPVGRVPTSTTGLRTARALADSLRHVGADCLIVDRPRDLRLGALAFFAHHFVLVNRYNLSRGNPPKDLLSRLAYLCVRLTIFVSATNAQQALARAKYLRRRPYLIIPEGVDPAFRPDPEGASRFCQKYGLVAGQFLLAVGSLTADKRYEFLFDVMARLGPDAPVLVICGTGPLASQLQAQAETLRLNVRFLGLVMPDLLPGAYTAALAFVHACQIETFGLSVLEAMACGKPVLAVRGGAVPEVLGDTGLLSLNDPVDFAERLRNLLRDPERQSAQGAAARRRAEQFSLGAMQEAYAQAIESILMPKAPV